MLNYDIMKPSIILNAPLRNLRVGSLVRYKGKFYLRGFVSKPNGIQLNRLDGIYHVTEYVPFDTTVMFYKGFPESLSGYGSVAGY